MVIGIIVLWCILSTVAFSQYKDFCRDLPAADMVIVFLIFIIGGPIFVISDILTSLLDEILPEGIVIGEVGSKIMDFSAAWSVEAERRGIRDPFKVSQKLFRDRCTRNADGSVSIDFPVKDSPLEPSQKEREDFIIARDTYIAERLFKEVGYEPFLREVENGYKDRLRPLLDRLLPCESADGQCSFFCPKYEECKK